MSRDKTEEYQQDRLGNVRRKIDELRAKEGNNGLDSDNGLVNVGSADTGSVNLLYSAPTHASQVIVDQLSAFNSVGSGDNTFTLYEVELDGSNSITSSTQRSVPINVSSGSTSFTDYHGEPFSASIGVSSEFQGQIGVGVFSDHHEEEEPASEQTEV